MRVTPRAIRAHALLVRDPSDSSLADGVLGELARRANTALMQIADESSVDATTLRIVRGRLDAMAEDLERVMSSLSGPLLWIGPDLIARLQCLPAAQR